MIQPYANVDNAVDDMAGEFWNNITVAMINRDVDLLYDNAISLKALEGARLELNKKMKKTG